MLVFPDGTGPALLSAMIAGIPLNRVHELDYEPGEIRFNVTMQSTLALMKDKNSENYSNKIAYGRKELKKLREMKLEDVISVKDRQLEKDRLEMEELSRKQEEKRLAKEEADRLAREARDRQIQDARQQRWDESGDGSTGWTTPILLGTAGVGIFGATAALMGGSEDEKETATLSDNPPLTNATAAVSQDSAMDVKVMERTMIDIPEIRSLDSDGASDISDNDEFTPPAQRASGDRQATFPPRPKQLDPVKAAEDAMKVYMDSDDGGSAWLEVVSEILTEEEQAKRDSTESESIDSPPFS